MSKTEAPTKPATEGQQDDDANDAVADLAAKIEVALMATDRPLNHARLAEAVSPPETKLGVKAVREAVAELNEQYESTGRTFRIEEVAGGWQIMTLPAHAEVVAALNRTRAQTKLSAAALETLAIIAYKQPVLKAEIEAIRGVACGEVIRSLMEKRMVKIVGRAEELGRPMLYGTTKAFLEVFGLKGLKDLPKVDEPKTEK